MFASKPVARLSSTRTFFALYFKRYSTRLEPMKPAPPVTKKVLFERSVVWKGVEYRVDSIDKIYASLKMAVEELKINMIRTNLLVFHNNGILITLDLPELHLKELNIF